MRRIGIPLCLGLVISMGLVGCAKSDVVNWTPTETAQLRSLEGENRDKKDTPDTIKEEVATATPSNKVEEKKDFVSLGSHLLDEEHLGFIKIGTSAQEVINQLQQPEEKSEIVVWGSDGLEHQTWYYKKNGIKLDMVRTQNMQKVNSATIHAPCNFRTARNIGIGSPKDVVLDTYEDTVNLTQNASNSTELVVGSVYGGITFKFEGTKVSSIFLGAVAE